MTVPLEPRDPQCVEGVMIVAARGSDPNLTNPDTTDPDYGSIDGLQNITEQVAEPVGKGSFEKAVPYPASSDFTHYGTSIGHGIDAAQHIIRDYVDRCKSRVHPKLIVLGYSQGANVMSEALVGGDARSSLDAYKQYIKAAALFADPSFASGVHPLDAGTAVGSGTAAKDSTSEHYFNVNYGHKIRIYCHRGDKYCASGQGPNALTIHWQEVPTYTNAAVHFLTSLVE